MTVIYHANGTPVRKKGGALKEFARATETSLATRAYGHPRGKGTEVELPITTWQLPPTKGQLCLPARPCGFQHLVTVAPVL